MRECQRPVRYVLCESRRSLFPVALITDKRLPNGLIRRPQLRMIIATSERILFPPAPFGRLNLLLNLVRFLRKT